MVTYNVRNIDKDAPDKTAPALKATTNSITATFEQKDDGSGIAKREYSIDNGTTWKVGDSVFTFSGLTQGKKYAIITRATDRVENQSISDVSYITTETIPKLVAGSNLTFTPSTSNWTNSNVSVAVSTTVKGYTLQTSTDGKTWKTTNPLTYSANGTAYARLWDGNNASAVATTNITNIDKLAPTNTAPTVATTTNKITVTLKQVDQNAANGSGKSDLNASKTQYRLVTDTNGTTAVTGKDWQSSNVFSGLTQNTTYYVQTKVTDNAGNTTTSAVATAKTTSIPTPTTGSNLTFTPTPSGWTNGNVSVKVSTTVTGYTLQTSTDGKTWSTTNPLIYSANGTAYARLWDGNNASAVATTNITNIDKLAPTISISGEAGNASVKINATTSDSQSGINSSSLKYKIDNGTWQTSNVFDNLDPDKTYTFVAQVTDNAGNSTESNKISVKPLGGVFVKLYDTDSDGTGDTLTFGNNPNYTYNGTLKTDYGNQKNIWTDPPWKNNESIKKADFVTNVKPKYTSEWFSGLTKLESINTIENLDTREVTNMYGMFYNCSSLTSLDVSNFDTSNVTNMWNMFQGCQSLTSLDVSNFDTSKVTLMSGMFQGCQGLTSLDVSNFNTSNVTNMSFMFCDCERLTSLDVSNYDTSKVTNMGYMFYDCEGLTSLDVSNFDTSNVTWMFGMFQGCQGLTSLNVSKFDTSKVTNMSYMFYDCEGLTSLNVRNFNTSKVTDMAAMFTQCQGLTSLDVSNFDTSNVTNIARMFRYCKSLTSLNVSNFNTSKVTDMAAMFTQCQGLTSLDVSNFDTSNVTDMYDMFSGCQGLTSLNVSKFDTSKVTNMSYMFYDCEGLTSLDVSNFNTSNVTDMSYMFSDCKGLTSLNVSNFNTSKVTNMRYMFSYCQSLTSLDLSNFNTSKVTNMGYMFCHCKGLTTIYVDSNKWSITNVTISDYMFESCPKLKGQRGTVYSSSHTDASYAKVDGQDGKPGYLTETGQIVGTMTPSSTTWTNKDVTVTVTETTRQTGYILQMSTDGQTYKDGTSITLTGNGTAYARLRDSSNNYGAIASLVISIIDKLAPTNTAPTVATTTNSVTVTNKQVDQNAGSGSGKSDLNVSKTQYRLVTDTNGTTAVTGKDWQSSNVFSGLTQNTTYYVQTKVTDNAGNTTISAVATAKTGTIPTPVRGSNVTFTATPTTKTSGDVTVTVSTTVTGYTLQSSTDGKTWGTTNPLIFSQNGTAYARLWDGTNASAVATFNVTNIETDPLKNTDRTIDDLNADGGDSNKDGVVDTKDDLRGFYIDLNNDGNLDTTNDGVIYGDLLTGGEGLYFCHTLEGIDTISEEQRAQFIQQMNDYCNYKIPTKSTLSTYEIIKDSNGNIKKFDGPFGSRGMLQRKTAVTNGDRFYVMALADFDSNTHCWYNKATNMTDYATYTSTSFGRGKENTSKMITAWNNKKYGEQTIVSSINGIYPNLTYKLASCIKISPAIRVDSDVWGVIQDKAKAGWFVPSRDEWNAFGAFFKVGGEYSKSGLDGNEHAFTDYYDYNKVYKLSNGCWSSSRGDTSIAYYVDFDYGGSIYIYVSNYFSVRLGSTF